MRKILIVNMFLSLLISLFCIIGVVNSTKIVYAKIDENVIDEYTLDGIKNLLNNEEKEYITQKLTVFNQDGTMNDLEVVVEGEDVNSDCEIQTRSSTFNVRAIVNSGRPDSQSIVVMIMGDGFTAAQQSYFITIATNYANSFLNQYPFSLFKDYFNIYAVEVISEESGVGRDVDEFDWWAGGYSVNNYFGSRFWHDANMFSNGTERLLYIQNEGRVEDLERPGTAMSIILCNSTRYGGGGGKYAVSSLNDKYVDITTHEFGHSFGGLGDEYWEEETFKEVEAPNKSKSVTKWSQWIDLSGSGIYRIGIYRIATNSNEDGYNWYKPSQNCKMGVSASPFCAVCSAELIRLFEKKTITAFDVLYGDNNKIKIEKLNLDYEGHFEIPQKIDGRVVSELGENLFLNNTNIEKITIPSSVTIIGDYAFEKCRNLTEIIIDQGTELESIGNYAFSYCTILTTIKLSNDTTATTGVFIPNSVETIGEGAFNFCTSMTGGFIAIGIDNYSK